MHQKMIYKRKIDKLDFDKIKNVCCEKNAIKRIRTRALNCRKYLKITYLPKDLDLEYINLSLNSILKMQTTQKRSKKLR